MLGNYEKRHFAEGEKIWLGRYRNLVNVLHWHFECEIIRIVEGSAKIKIGNFCFEATKDDCFFCSGEELHYIISESNSQIDIAILDKNLVADITDKYAVDSPKLPNHIPVKKIFDNIEEKLSQKEPFYREALENYARGLIIDIFSHCQIAERKEKVNLHKTLITKINTDFSFITFKEAVHYSGYSASHFSKTFKMLTGMSFSEYLNIIRIENAIMLLRNNTTITSVSQECGFSTIRNFNRVFKKVTGYPPRSLPKDFIIDTGLHISGTDHFDPTDKSSILIQQKSV